MEEEILLKFKADQASLDAALNDVKKKTDSTIETIEANPIQFKITNANELSATLKQIAKNGGDAYKSLANGVDEVVNDTQKLKQLTESLNKSLLGVKKGSQEYQILSDIINGCNTQLKTLEATNTKAGVSLRTQMRLAQEEVAELSQKYGENSKQAIEAAKRAAELRDTLEDANDKIKAFKGEGAFNATAKAIQATASGFAALQGAMGLFGDESEEVQKAILKVNSALALAQGLEGLEDAGRSFSTLATVIKTNVVSAFTTLRGAIAATGIGLLAVAIGTIIANWQELIGWIDETFPSLKRVTDFFRNFQQNAAGVLSSVVAGFRTLGDVVAKIFKGDFKGAFDSAKSLGDNMAKAFREGYDKKDTQLKNEALAKERVHQQKRVKIAKEAEKELYAERQKFNSAINEKELKDLSEKKKAEKKALDDGFKELNAILEQEDRIKKQNADKEKKRKEEETARLAKQLEQQREQIIDLISFAENGILLQLGINPQDVDRVKSQLQNIFATIDKTTKDLSAGVITENEARLAVFQSKAEFVASGVQTISNALFESDKQRREEELQQLNAQKEEELRLAGDNEQKKDLIRQKYALKEKEYKRKQAEADKRKAIFDSIIATAVAVVRALPNVFLAAVAGALGLAQTALIAATPIPKFAKGVLQFDGKGGLVGGTGTGTSDSNLAYLSKGESVIPAENTSNNIDLVKSLIDGTADEHINKHYVMPALQAKEKSINDKRRNDMLTYESNMIARISSGTLKSIDKKLSETNQSIKGLKGRDYSW